MEEKKDQKVNKDLFDKIENFLITKKAIPIVGIILVAMIIFIAGVSVGHRKAGFSYKWGEDYYRNFGGFRQGFKGEMDRRIPNSDHLLNMNGAVGKIIKIDLPAFVVEGPDGLEKVVETNNETLVRQFRETLDVSKLKVDDFVVVVGSPNEESQVVAKLIRIMPVPPSEF